VVAVKPEHRGDADAHDQGYVQCQGAVLAEPVLRDEHDPHLDQQADPVEDHEKQALAAHPLAAAVLERPVPVADESEDRRHDGGDRRRHHGAQLGTGVQRVRADQRDDGREHPHDAELRDLVDHHPETRVEVADHEIDTTPRWPGNT
jgi:hypothetical protein